MLGIESSTECGPRLDGNGAAAQEAMPAGGNSTRFDSLAAHFGELGISGQGLETAAQGMPLVGPVIGAAGTLFVLKTHFTCLHLFMEMVQLLLPALLGHLASLR